MASIKLAVWVILALLSFYILADQLSNKHSTLGALMGGLPCMLFVFLINREFQKGVKSGLKNTHQYSDVLKMTPYEFEHYVAKLLQNMGYSARVTSKSDGEEGGDYGADIIAKKDGRIIVVQVKKWAPRNLVGNQDVRSVVGSLHTFKASKAILVTTSDFTEQAYEQAKGAPIELWNGAYLRKLMAEYA